MVCKQCSTLLSVFHHSSPAPSISLECLNMSLINYSSVFLQEHSFVFIFEREEEKSGRTGSLR